MGINYGQYPSMGRDFCVFFIYCIKKFDGQILEKASSIRLYKILSIKKFIKRKKNSNFCMRFDYYLIGLGS